MLVSFLITTVLMLLVGSLNAAESGVRCARRGRLEAERDRGVKGASSALELIEDVDAAATSLRVGIMLLLLVTLILLGGYLPDEIERIARGVAGEAKTVSAIWYTAVVVGIASIVLLLGGVLPARLGERYPEATLRKLSRLALSVHRFFTPCIVLADRVLSAVLPNSESEEQTDVEVEEDIITLVDEGERAGVIEAEEKEIISRVFKLDDRPVASLMTPRADVDILKVTPDIKSLLLQVAESEHSWFPVQGGGEDEILGIVSVHDLIKLESSPHSYPSGIRGLLVKPLEVPESMSGLKLLELFRSEGARFAIVRDEYGVVAGIATIYDVLQVIVGEIGDVPQEEKSIVQRDDGSYLVDATTDVRDLFELLGIESESPFKGGEFHSLGGYVMTILGYVPREGSHFDAHGFTFEVIDMDNNRIDKVLVAKAAEKKARAVS